ncbi:hypothetical protein OH76DRAFT_1421335 [Lentinus brumalis]|uniref:Uncharacterized protein n=1 Tax=Lentinus brumalis TaxID=2498619 RepID=A0A371CWE4_9APHY|nr:hypothetical protein OH76DRAFT_1421335 [Polyporus brumalis]
MSSPADNHLDAREETPLSQFLAHDFASDNDFQQGIAGILSSGVLEGKTHEEKRDLLLRSEVFYFNRKNACTDKNSLSGSSVTVEEARIARAGQTAHASSQAPSQASSTEEEPQTLTFAQLTTLIEQGRTDEIPNNKVIPNVLSSDPPSESKSEVRKKPWEINAAA